MITCTVSRKSCTFSNFRRSSARATNQAQWRSFSRPTFAPHPILDVKHIAQNPGLYEQNCISRNYPSLSNFPWQILHLRNENARLNRKTIVQRQEIRSLQESIFQTQKQTQSADDDGVSPSSQNYSLEMDREKARRLKEQLEVYTKQISDHEEEIQEKALLLPNLSSIHTPGGSEPKVLETFQNIPADRVGSLTKSHVEIGTDLDILDFNKSAATSGYGWYFLTSAAALLEQALVQFVLSELVRRGWQVFSPPSMVYSHIADACGFQPRDQNDEQQIYHIESQQRKNTIDSASHVLAGTAEIPLAGMYANQTVQASSLPLRTVAVSRCYRAEAGGRGAETKGLYRVHEFTKVEMFAWTLPDELHDDNEGSFSTSSDSRRSQSDQIFDEMLQIQQDLLNQIGLNFRILEMPSGDLGASASRKTDIEVFFPSRRDRDNGWGEVTSASLCTDYQSRRLRTRLQRKGSNQLEFPHTMNGTAMAIPRMLAAILECFWDEQHKRVTVPAVLKPWMHGIEAIEARKPI